MVAQPFLGDDTWDQHSIIGHYGLLQPLRLTMIQEGWTKVGQYWQTRSHMRNQYALS
jgi:hypothetical protein